ncbi:MAG TPA: zinc dependent phospholipase C family protein [Terriglobus sp.]
MHSLRPSVLLRSVTCLVLLVLAMATPPAHAYSVLTHEQLIDLTWDASIVPLLRSRYPNLTAAELEQARAYAYGGCVIQDIGYYPFGDAFFSNLTHYVRSGDFVVNLFRNAQNANELAFAVGALSHYIGDNVGHATATNLAVPVEFPKLADRYGRSVNYAQGTHQHVRVEFAFDVNEIVHHRLAPVHYLRHVGLEVATRQLSLAFYQTYGIRADFSSRRKKRINVGGYRFSVRSFLPRIAYAVTVLHRRKSPPETDSDDLRKLDTEITAVAQKNNWDAYRKNAGIGTYMLAGVLWVLPKWGPISMVSVKGPTTDTETEYVHSVLVSTDRLNAALRRFTPPPATVTSLSAANAPVPTVAPAALSTAPASERRGTRNPPDPQHPLANRDLDTGVVVRPGGYPLTDETFCRLAHTLAADPTLAIPPGIKKEVLGYYANMDLPFATRKHADAWKQLQADLVVLQGMPTSTEPEPYPTFGDPEPDDED